MGCSDLGVCSRCSVLKTVYEYMEGLERQKWVGGGNYEFQRHWILSVLKSMLVCTMASGLYESGTLEDEVSFVNL